MIYYILVVIVPAIHSVYPQQYIALQNVERPCGRQGRLMSFTVQLINVLTRVQPPPQFFSKSRLIQIYNRLPMWQPPDLYFLCGTLYHWQHGLHMVLKNPISQNGCVREEDQLISKESPTQLPIALFAHIYWISQFHWRRVLTETLAQINVTFSVTNTVPEFTLF